MGHHALLHSKLTLECQNRLKFKHPSIVLWIMHWYCLLSTPAKCFDWNNLAWSSKFERVEKWLQVNWSKSIWPTDILPTVIFTRDVWAEIRLVLSFDRQVSFYRTFVDQMSVGQMVFDQKALNAKMFQIRN